MLVMLQFLRDLGTPLWALILIAVAIAFFLAYQHFTSASFQSKDATIELHETTIAALQAKIEQLEAVAGEPSPQGLATDLSTPSLAADHVFENVRQVHNHLTRIMTSELESRHRVRIDNIGLDYEVTGNLVAYELVHSEKYSNVHYRGLVLDPDATEFESIIDGESNLKSSLAREVAANLTTVGRPHEGKLRDRQATVELRRYGIPLMLHGFLVNGEHLYLGGTEFDSGKLSGGQFPYLYLTLNETAIRRHLFAQFQTWFDHLWGQSETWVRLGA